MSTALRTALCGAWEAPWAIYDRTAARLLRMPGLFLGRELQEHVGAVTDAWMGLLRASGPLAVLLADASARSVPQVARRLVAEAVSRRTRLDGQAIVEALIEGGERAFEVTLDSEEYARAQARFINAAMLYRARERELADVLLRLGHVAGRTEVEEVGRSLHSLRRELRSVRRELAEVRSAAGRSRPAQSDGAAGDHPARSRRPVAAVEEARAHG
jgi:class III poly(R)-hydroxyalkanoic acid synthase PhaE subunit